MGYWNSLPNKHNCHGLIEIPEGNYRARIYDVYLEMFGETKMCFEITFEISGHPAKVWHYLWFDSERQEECSKKFNSFFNSFGICDSNLSNYEEWVGKQGAVKIKHQFESGSESFDVKIAYFWPGAQKDKLPAWFDDFTPKEIFNYDINYFFYKDEKDMTGCEID